MLTSKNCSDQEIDFKKGKGKREGSRRTEFRYGVIFEGIRPKGFLVALRNIPIVKSDDLQESVQ